MVFTQSNDATGSACFEQTQSKFRSNAKANASKFLANDDQIRGNANKCCANDEQMTSQMMGLPRLKLIYNFKSFIHLRQKIHSSMSLFYKFLQDKNLIKKNIFKYVMKETSECAYFAWNVNRKAYV